MKKIRRFCSTQAISVKGRRALKEWKKICDYIVPSITLFFNEEAFEKAIELAVKEKITYQFSFGFSNYGHGIEVPAALVCVFAHLSPRMVKEEDEKKNRLLPVDSPRPANDAPTRRKLLTREEAKEEIKRQIKRWERK